MTDDMWWADPDVATTDPRRLAALVAHGNGVERDLAVEIEQLRAENQSWRSLDQIRLNLLRQSADELRRLQAKVDAYAAVWNRDLAAVGDALALAVGEWFAERVPDDLHDAIAAWEEARLGTAAATKEDDRG